MHVRFEVPGVPSTKGSTRSFRHAKTGKIVTLSDNPRLKEWEAAIKYFATRVWSVPPLRDPIHISMTFAFPRPKSAPPKKRPCVIVKPDLDKLVRAVLDACTGVFWYDDAQVIGMSACKVYVQEGKAESVISHPGVVVSVFSISTKPGGSTR